MPKVDKRAGLEARRTYEDAGLSREQFAAMAHVTPKQVSDITRGGRVVGRYLAARVTRALNQIQSQVHWTPDRIFDEQTSGQQATEQAPGEAPTSPSAPASSVRRAS